MKTVLFIAYNFPPAGGAGVQRSLKFVKYLPQLGWNPVVITTTPDAYPVLDESLWDDVPDGVPVYRAKSYDINGLRPHFNRLKLGKVLSALNVALQLPDAAFFWARLARSVMQEAIEKYQPDLIYSSSAPASAHLLGKWGRKKFAIPWSADFRDPWSEVRLTPFYPGYRGINGRLEQKVLTTADCVITVSQPLADDLQRLSGNDQSKVLVIENGYDEDDVTPLPPQRTDRFTITYTGTFSRLRRPDAFVTAIEHLISSGQIPLDKIRVVIAGKDTAKYIPDCPPFEQLGYLNHDALIDLRRQTDLLLLIQDPSPENWGAYSGKLFEYLGTNRPTLAVSHPNNVASQLIARAQAGLSTRHALSEITTAVLHYYHIWQTGHFAYAPKWEIIHEYSRRNLTARLADEFNRLTIAESSI